MAALELSGTDAENIYENLEERIAGLVEEWLGQADETLPIILTAHASVQGAVLGGERMVMLGNDLVLSGSLVKNPRLDYVALGHIHKPQNVNRGNHPPVIYPGSIERVDFGEAEDDKYFVLAQVARGETSVEWVKLATRPFIDRRVTLQSAENVTEALISALPDPGGLSDAIVRLSVEYPREWDSLIDESEVRKYASTALEFHLLKRPVSEARVRIPPGQTVSSLSPLDLLDQYFRAAKIERTGDLEALKRLAGEIISEDRSAP
jgi:exonuclease SbcD